MATTNAQGEEATAAGESTDSPVLDLSDQAVKRLIKTAKSRGYITYDELNEVLPSEEVSSEKIEDILSMLSDMGVNVVDADEVEEAQVADYEMSSARIHSLVADCSTDFPFASLSVGLAPRSSKSLMISAC